MNVEKIMTRTVRTCSPEDTLDTAARLMWEHDCGCVPVVDADGRVLAMLTDRDVCMAAYTQGRPLNDIHVRSAMSEACFAIGPRDPIIAAERVMRDHQVRRLPVVSDGQLVGLVSLTDITCEAARENGSHLSDVTLDEVAVTLSAVCQPRLETNGAQEPREPGARRSNLPVARTAVATN
jgi:CBS domain-containing protein